MSYSLYDVVILLHLVVAVYDHVHQEPRGEWPDLVETIEDVRQEGRGEERPVGGGGGGGGSKHAILPHLSSKSTTIQYPHKRTQSFQLQPTVWYMNIAWLHLVGRIDSRALVSWQVWEIKVLHEHKS